jgi:hypothetical protein
MAIPSDDKLESEMNKINEIINKFEELGDRIKKKERNKIP